MKKINLSEVDWNHVQNLYEKENVYLKDLGLSRKTIVLALTNGLLKKKEKYFKWNDEQKKLISEKRKKWLTENPEKHVWRKKTKFLSVPCEKLKNFLKEKGINFQEEVLVSKKNNYSVDILIPDKNLILEINGNQHYDKSGNLKPYYQERHNFLTSLGFVVLEIHYTMAFNHNLIEKMINEQPKTSSVLPFFIKEKKRINKYGSRDEYNKNKKENWVRENEKYISLIQNSNIDFSKFGWVIKVSNLINKKPQKINNWMKKMMPDFYEQKCFKKKTMPL